MKTISWIRTSTFDGVRWELVLGNGRLDAWRNGFRVRTIDEEGKDWFINRNSWPMDIARAWNDMVDVMKKEAVR
jgi:hypothetical protein